MEITNFKPLGDRVLIKPFDAGEQKFGGILIADMNEDNCRIGEVVAVGPGRKTEFGTSIDVHVEPGQIVVLPKIGATRVVLDGEEYWTIQDREIIGTVDIKK